MNFLEKDLEEIIFNTPKEILSQRGLPIFGIKKRQLRLGKYGIADLVTIERDSLYFDSHYIITVYELKKDKIGISSFLQVLGYTKAIKTYLEDFRKITNFTIKIVLIGKELDTTGSFCYIPELFTNNSGFSPLGQIIDVNFYTYSFDINGFSFLSHYGYGVDNPFFKF